MVGPPVYKYKLYSKTEHFFLFKFYPNRNISCHFGPSYWGETLVRYYTNLSFIFIQKCINNIKNRWTTCLTN